MIYNERQELILDILRKQQFVSVSYLAGLFDCSAATIRRDFSKLEADNQLNQIRGGAELVAKTDAKPNGNDSNRYFPSFLDAHGSVNKKRIIAKRAVELCSDGESIFIGDGDHTESMAEFMATINLNILTNSLQLASELTNYSRVQCSLIGGVLNRQRTAIPGKNEEALIQYYPCGKIFVSTSDRANHASLLESSNTSILQKLRNQADELIVLCESAKLNNNTDSIINLLAEGDALITDDAVIPSLLLRIKDLGIRCIIAESHQHEAVLTVE